MARIDVTCRGSDTVFVDDLFASRDCKHESGHVLRSAEVYPVLFTVPRKLGARGLDRETNECGHSFSVR